jgi:hypothetical protein
VVILIQALRRMGEYLACYMEGGVGLIDYVGPQPIYQRRMKITTGGVIAARSVVPLGPEMDGVHAYMGESNLYAFNGSPRPQSLGDRVWKYWLDRMHVLTRPNVYAFRDSRHKEIIFGYQGNQAEGFSHALVWNYEYDCFSVRDWPFSAVGFVRKSSGAGVTIPQFDEIETPMDDLLLTIENAVTVADFDLLAGASDGKLYRLDDSTDEADGVDIQAVWETGDDCFGDPVRRKICGGLLIDAPEMTGSPLQVYVCARNSLDQPVTWAGPYLFAGDSNVRRFTASGRFFRFKFFKPDGALTLRNYAPLVQLRGEW